MAIFTFKESVKVKIQDKEMTYIQVKLEACMKSLIKYEYFV